jgi:hypothetical protein
MWEGPEPNRVKWVRGESINEEKGFKVKEIREYDDQFAVHYKNGHVAYVPRFNKQLIEVEYDE